MFVQIFECGDKPTNEEEYFGYHEGGRPRTLAGMLDWLEKVNASGNATYLKCLNGSTQHGVIVNSISDIVFTDNIVHKNATTSNGVKIAFRVEGPSTPALSLAQITAAFQAIADDCAKQGIDTDNVELFAEDKNGKLTEFGWFYDTDSDTAVLIKNMSFNVCRQFLSGATDVIVRAAKTPTTPADVVAKIMDKIDKIDLQMKELAAKKDAAWAEYDAIPKQA